MTQPTVHARAYSFGVAQLLLGRLGTMGLQFAVLVVVARALGPSKFGALQLAMAAFVYVGWVSDLGLSILGARQVTLDVAPGELMAARLLLAVPALAGLAVVAIVVDAHGTALAIVAILGLGTIANAIHLRWLLQSASRFGRIAVADIVAAGLQMALAVLLVHGPNDLVVAAGVVAMQPVASSLIALAWSRSFAGLRLRAGRTTIQLVRTALPLGVAGLATAIYYGADSLMLGAFRSVTEVGNYGAAYRIVLACLVLPQVGHAVALPLLSRLVQEQGDDLAGFLKVVSKALILVALPIAAGGSLLAEPLIVAIFGGDFRSATLPFSLLIWSVLTVSANAPFGALMLARHDDRRYMKLTVAGAVVNLGLNAAMIPLFGMAGAALTTLASEIVVVGLILRATSDVSWRILAASLRAVLPATLAMAIAVLPIRTSLLSAIVGVVVFVIVAILTRAVSLEDLQQLRKVGRPAMSSGFVRPGGGS